MAIKKGLERAVLTDTHKHLLICLVSFGLLGLSGLAPKNFLGPAWTIVSLVFGLIACAYALRLFGRARIHQQNEIRKRQIASHKDFLELQEFVQKGGPKVAERYARALSELKLGEDASLWTQQDLFTVAELIARRDPAGDGWIIRAPLNQGDHP